MTTPRRRLARTLGWWLSLWVGAAGAAPIHSGDGLTADATDSRLTSLACAGRALPATVGARLFDPRTGAADPPGFTIRGAWRAIDGGLRLDGEVTAAGDEDQVADLVVRVEGATLPLGSLPADPLLLPARLLSKLPLVSLRVGEADELALAVPPDRLGLHEFREREGGVELRFPFGFTSAARPELRRRAPFAVVLYRTAPQWHFRSALAGYYRLFPEPFQPFVSEPGGWFFAAETKDLPNPQHFAYHEGGPSGWELDRARGMGTYPYRESSSATVSLGALPRPTSYDEALARFNELEQRVMPQGWQPQTQLALDETVKRTGTRSLLADAGDTGTWSGALQAVDCRPFWTGPIQVQGASRAAGVTGERDSNYAIYVDVTYDDGSYLFGQCATFATGTHDWEVTRHVIQPTRPVASLRVFCLLRGHHGRAWFDDVVVGPADQPAVNWLVNGGFETLAPPRELQSIRRNVCFDPAGRWVFNITDNLSADVGPAQPLNLLRFSLNVDPDLPSTEAEPSVAARELSYFDNLFRTQPELAGAYIDSVSAWCARVLNTRRDQWPAADVPFTYAPGGFQVATHGRFAMQDYLATLQERYHPLGKAVFTNIHVDLNSFPLYLASDVPGIESSQFGDPSSTFFYRAASYHKPLVLLNFINLHGLHRRTVAEAYHREAARFALFPSTGRFVQEGYRLYGDLTHRWHPATQDLFLAGWEPVPLASGAWVERFGGGDAVWFTVDQAAGPTRLLVERAALSAAGPVEAWDAVSLTRLPVEPAEGGWAVTLPAGDPLRVVRLGPAAGAQAWLVARAVRHLRNVERVRGATEPAVQGWLQALAQPSATRVAEVRAGLGGRLKALPGGDEDLFAVSERRELVAAEQALRAWQAGP